MRSIARWLGHRQWFARVGRVLVPGDRLVGRLTGGRVVALGLAPALLLTTTGRRSGRERTTPLLYVDDGGGYVVVGSNWGRASQPAWALNLLAHPEGSVRVGGRVIPVRARVLSGAERGRAWRLALRAWPAYDTYARRAAGRRLHVFRLVPRPDSGHPDSGHPDSGHPDSGRPHSARRDPGQGSVRIS
jgi:deazaflavin-dependent oxidoreductase (nitroreductase family)